MSSTYQSYAATRSKIDMLHKDRKKNKKVRELRYHLRVYCEMSGTDLLHCWYRSATRTSGTAIALHPSYAARPVLPTPYAVLT
eukprot:3930823-Rhodomonas_salina.2